MSIAVSRFPKECNFAEGLRRPILCSGKKGVKSKAEKRCWSFADRISSWRRVCCGVWKWISKEWLRTPPRGRIRYPLKGRWSLSTEAAQQSQWRRKPNRFHTLRRTEWKRRSTADGSSKSSTEPPQPPSLRPIQPRLPPNPIHFSQLTVPNRQSSQRKCNRPRKPSHRR